MILYISKLFICFIIFSFLGWVLEVLYGFYKLKKFVNRGFLIGPLCPIYGVSCVILYLLLSPINNPISLFIISAFFCTIVEYLASYILEKIFKVRWWDYDYMKYNINGRVCLEMMIPFGLLGFLSVSYFVPFTLNIISELSISSIYVIALILFILFASDLILSTTIISKFKKSGVKSNEKDNTVEVSNYVKKTMKKKTSKRKN